MLIEQRQRICDTKRQSSGVWTPDLFAPKAGQ
jgi:hypothetical protein